MADNNLRLPDSGLTTNENKFTAPQGSQENILTKDGIQPLISLPSSEAHDLQEAQAEVFNREPDSGFVSAKTDENHSEAPQDSQEIKFVDVNLEEEDEFGNTSDKKSEAKNLSPHVSMGVDEAGPSKSSSSVTESFSTPSMTINQILWIYVICCGFLLSMPMSGLQSNYQQFPINPPVEVFQDQWGNETENGFQEDDLEDDDEFEFANYISSGMKDEAEKAAKSLRASMANETGTSVDEPRPSNISSAILEMLEIPLEIRLTVNEKRSLGYLIRSIAGFTDKMAQRLLFHCTSSNLLLQPIRIDYGAVRRGLAKAFTADTNRNVLYIPTTYDSYQDFEAEFKRIIRKNTWRF